MAASRAYRDLTHHHEETKGQLQDIHSFFALTDVKSEKDPPQNPGKGNGVFNDQEHDGEDAAFDVSDEEIRSRTLNQRKRRLYWKSSHKPKCGQISLTAL